eukprot:2142632-Amphidinium_carterae.2
MPSQFDTCVSQSNHHMSALYCKPSWSKDRACWKRTLSFKCYLFSLTSYWHVPRTWMTMVKRSLVWKYCWHLKPILVQLPRQAGCAPYTERILATITDCNIR